MERKHIARRTPPATSVEEVLLHRLTTREASSAAPKGNASRSSSARSKPLTTNTRQRGSAAHAASTLVPAYTLLHTDHPANQAVEGLDPTRARLEFVAQDVRALDQRLQAIHRPTADSPPTSSSSAPSSTTTPTVSHHQQEIARMLDTRMAALTSAYSASSSTMEPSSSFSPSTPSSSLDPQRGAHVTSAVRSLRSTVRRLDRVFYDVATGDKQRQLAATTLTTLVRGFLVRRRFFKLQRALGTWRARTCATALLQLEQFAAREGFLRAQTQRMHRERETQRLRHVLTELRDVTLANLPLRRRRLEEASLRFQRVQRAVLADVWRAWKRSALGPRARKTVRAEARRRHAAARQRLTALDRFRVLTPEMVHDEFLKENLRLVRQRHTFWTLTTCWAEWRRQEWLPLQRKTMVAEAHARTHLLRLVWQRWLPLFRATQVDRALAKSGERRTLQRFDRPVNLRAVDAHYRRAMQRRHLCAWAWYHHRVRRVRRLFESQSHGHRVQLLARWRVRATYQARLRAHALEMWRALGRRLTQTPFRAWYCFAAHRRAHHAAQQRICDAYARRARRQTKYAFFRLWQHQTLFGHIEALHSKVHLLRALEDQKRLCLGLQVQAQVTQTHVAALQQTIAALEQELQRQHDAQSEQVARTQATRFAAHGAEQGIARLQGLLDALRQLHPGSVAAVERAGQSVGPALLTPELGQVVARQAAQRRELEARMALDATEMEIQEAAPRSGGGGGAWARADQLLLHRVKWVLSRVDLHPAVGMERGEGEQEQEQQAVEPRASQRRMVPAAAVDQLCALLEFVRDGDTTALSRVNDPSRQRQRQQQERQRQRQRQQEVGAEATRTLGGTETEMALGSKAEPLPEMEDVCVVREDVEREAPPWHAFVEALTLKFAPERMRLLQERVLQRAAEMDAELGELKANPHIYNAYSGSAPLPPRNEGTDRP